MGLTDRRIGLLFAIFLLLLCIARAANTQQVDEIEVPARRGTITDRHGVELAVSEPASDVAVTPYLVKQPLKVAKQLAPYLEDTEAELLRKLNRRDTGFIYLGRKVGGSQAAAMHNSKRKIANSRPMRRSVSPTPSP